MARPSVAADWATNANYSAGGYNGQTNKSAPPAGNIAEGFNAGYGLPAEWLNYMLNNHGAWITYLDTATGPIWGDGSDSARTLDGAATILGMVPSGNVYTATRDLFFTDLTINTGISLKMRGFRLYGTGTLTMSGTAKITANGANASAATIGVGGGNGGILSANANNDGAAVDAGHGQGSSTSLPAALGVAGGAGGAGIAGASTSAVTAPTAVMGGIHVAASLVSGMLWGASGVTVVQGGSGGGAGSGDGGGGLDGGAGGGGGGVILVAFRSIAIANTAALEVKGGNGGNAAGGGGLKGGGGGGGGGAVVFVYHIVASGSTPDAVTSFTGGTGGSQSGGGSNGSNGSTGSNANNLIAAVL